MDQNKEAGEQGRSLLEILAVLAIAALLLLGTTFGYNFLIQIKNRHDAVKIVQDVVIAADTTDILKRYQPGDAIRMRELVNTVGSTDGGYAMQLPDGEDSKVIVTAMKNNQYALSLKIDKDTCSDMIEAFAKMKATYFSVNEDELYATETTNTTFVAKERDQKGLSHGENDPGLRLNPSNPELEKMKAEAIARCAETGTAGAVFNCSSGNISYGYIYGFLCAGCPLGDFFDGKVCCKPSEVCGGTCNACPDSYCHPINHTCVECYVNGVEGKIDGIKQCTKKYEDDFSHHVCNPETSTCTECLEDLDCTTKLATYKVENPNENNKFCIDNVCSPCTGNYGVLGEGMCPEAKPVCDYNKGCVPCPGTRKYDVHIKACGCPEGKILTSNGECSNCVYSSKQNPDPGCSRELPVCDESQETEEKDGNETTTFMGVCVGCLENADCGANAYCEDGKCVPCPADKPVWDNESEECRVCFDSNTGVGSDEGCKNSDKHYCDPMGNEGLGECHLCIDSEAGAAVDAGCSTDSPICKAETNDGSMEGFGNDCVQCLSTEDCSGEAYCEDGVCKSCSAGTVLNPDTEKCVVCIDNEEGTSPDKGCESGENHFCNESDNNNQGKCYLCMDSDSGTDMDAGCQSDKPICAATTNDGSMTTGASCGNCWTDEDCEDGQICNQDTHTCRSKCPEEKPLWNGKECIECTTNSDCSSRTDGKIWCDTSKGVCVGCNGNYLSGATHACAKEKPVCNKGVCDVCATGWSDTLKKCTECTTDSHCSSRTDGKIWCNTAAGTCVGCSNHYSSGLVRSCPSSSKPYCHNGTCKTCTELNAKTADGHVMTLFGKGASSGKLGCYLCADDKDGNAVDTGCGTAKPRCAGTTAHNGGLYNSCFCPSNKPYSNTKGACIECTTNSHCSSRTDGKTWCDTTTGTCVGCNGHYTSGKTRACGSSKPYCHNGTCKTCVELNAKTDAGEVKKLFGQSASGNLGCFLCKDDKDGNSQDTGCSANKKRCGSNKRNKTNKHNNTCSCPTNKPKTLSNGTCVECAADKDCGSGKVCSKDHTCKYAANDSGCTAKYNSNCSHYESHDGKTGCWNNGWSITKRSEGKCSKSGWKFYGKAGSGVCKQFCGAL